MNKNKFRAWDKVNKKMIFDSDIQKEDVYLSLTLDGTLYDIAFDRMDKIADNYELEQFTGLYDRNGVEIYEGDILVWSSGVKDDPRLSIVVFNEDEAAFQMICSNVAIGMYKDYCNEYYKIIGNVYENPELMELNHETSTTNPLPSSNRVHRAKIRLRRTRTKLVKCLQSLHALFIYFITWMR